jgi:hypothetical protein
MGMSGDEMADGWLHQTVDVDIHSVLDLASESLR